MGCGSSARTSEGSQPVLPAAQVHPADPEKCLRAGCKFKKHSTQEHGYCCNLCRMKGEHGPLCEKCDLSKPSSSKSADRVSLKWEPSLLFGPKCMGFDIEGGVTATETMHIEPHKGELFASFGKWMSPEYQKAQKSGKWIVNPLHQQTQLCRWQMGRGYVRPGFVQAYCPDYLPEKCDFLTRLQGQ